MIEMMHKMGWQSLCLVVSSTYDGKIFADAMKNLASREKLTLVSTVWINGVENLTETRRDLRNVIAKKADVLITHLGLSTYDMNEIFQMISELRYLQNSRFWLVSDATIHGVRSLTSLPSGIIMISARSPEMRLDPELYINALYDSFVLFESAFKRSLQVLGEEKKKDNFSSVKWNSLRESTTR